MLGTVARMLVAMAILAAIPTFFTSEAAAAHQPMLIEVRANPWSSKEISGENRTDTLLVRARPGKPLIAPDRALSYMGIPWLPFILGRIVDPEHVWVRFSPE